MIQEITPVETRVALVTGGSRGIGRAICVALAAQGCSVAINYASNAVQAEETAALCAAAAAEAGFSEPRFIVVGGDVATEEGCEKIYRQTTTELGAPDILINNAGIVRDNLIMRMSVEDFDAVIDVNLRAAFLLSKHAARSMTKKRFGRIINVSSVVGIAGSAGQANYASSKAGLIGLTKSLAKELGSRSVTVNAVAPGFIETDMTDVLNEQVRSDLMDRIALKRLGKPEDIAASVAFLATDAAAYITGHVLTIDGGMAL